MFKTISIKFKKMFLPTFICLFTLSLLIFSKYNLQSAKSGLSLWINSVVPSLFPFFIATELLGYTNIINILGKIFNPIMKPLFNVPGEGSFPFIMGIISGYPVGAKIVANFKEQGVCSNVECERLLAFTNNSGPLFIIGTVGISLFKDTSTGILLFITHILSCLTVAFLFRWWKKDSKQKKIKANSMLLSNNNVSISNLGEVLSTCIVKSINSIVLIGGFIVLFSVIVSILQESNIVYSICNFLSPIFNIFHIPYNFSQGLIIGIIELTNGVYIISNIAYKSISLNVIICAFLLGFGGISITLQILSITSKARISIKPYLIGKFLQGLFAAIYTYLFLNFFPIFNLNLPI